MSRRTQKPKPQVLPVALTTVPPATTPYARIDLPTMQSLALAATPLLVLGSWCQVITPTLVLFCRLWTLETGLLVSPAGSGPAVCVASTNISRPVTDAETLEVRKAGGTAVVKSWAAKLPRASQVVIEVLRTPGSQGKPALRITPERALRILSGAVVGIDCVIDDPVFDGAFRLSVVSIDCEDGDMDCDAIVHRGTAIVIETPPAPAVQPRRPAAQDAVVDMNVLDGGLAGLDDVYKSLMQLVVYPLRYATTLRKLGIQVPKAVLLSGPPGIGKTSVVSAVAKACNANMFVIQGPEVFGSYLGQSEERLRSKFAEAQAAADSASQSTDASSRPAILFIDEIDVLAPRREGATREASVVAQLLTLMDGMTTRTGLFIIAATNRPNAIDPALRRPGRFDREIQMDVPTEGVRHGILTRLTQLLPLDASVDTHRLAAATMGYVGADLAALVREASLSAAMASSPAITQKNFETALARTGASAMRGSSVDVVRTVWDDIGGLETAKLKLRQAVEWPIAHKDTFARLGLKRPRGILLYGPPGCSKTTLAKAVASTAKATFFTIHGAALYSAYVGESERIVRSLFQRARSASPAVIFLDEIDTIVGKRSMGDGGSSGDSVQERVLSALLNEMDGIETAKDVLVLGATNRPDMIDAALMRPGRFDRVIYIPPPQASARHHILTIHTRGMPLHESVDLAGLADKCVNMTGADLKGLCREAALTAVRDGSTSIQPRHFDSALSASVPTLSDDMIAQYASFSAKFGS
ncbi:P-loop containing nucleoside triphosphate hydrolase protein [Entophlyctis helioformis]|nr:P-loop containing nucleoside triphosphate hydrolase protein [Entophlyctis helioformis]